MIELNHRYALTTPDGTISDAGIAEILRYTQAQRMTWEQWAALNPTPGRAFLPDFPDDWAWVWLVTGRADYTGTFPKRAGRFYFKAHGLRSPDIFLQELGNLARRHASAPVAYSFDFVNEFDWRDGDFGDDGSCYWGDRSSARVMLADNGGLAIRFFDDEGNGIARAWLVPVGTTFVIFNGYGFAGDATLTIAQVAAQFFGATYKLIDLSNNGDTTGVLYINGGVGYVIGAPADVENIARHDFRWDEIHDYFCENCGDGISEDDAYYSDYDGPYCERCYNRLFDNCEDCGQDVPSGELTEAAGHYVCENCLERRYTRCDHCEEYVRNADAIMQSRNASTGTTDDGTFCENCAPEKPPDE